jgi:hypothetical protein
MLASRIWQAEDGSGEADEGELKAEIARQRLAVADPMLDNRIQKSASLMTMRSKLPGPDFIFPSWRP